MIITLLMNLIMKSKESKLLYYRQEPISFLFFLQCVAILHFYNNKYVIIPGLTREVTNVIDICLCHIYER